MKYHFLTQLLSTLDMQQTPVLNSPQGLRNANEKLSILHFPALIAPTLVSSSTDQIQSFLAEHRTIVLKPLHLFGGQGIHIVRSGEDIPSLTQLHMAQAYLPAVTTTGDKRILLLGGEPLGAIRRIPKKGDFRANMAAGGKAEPYTLQKEDARIVAALKPYLIKQGLDFVGIDVIDDKLIEINVTCPTGLVQVAQYADEKEDVLAKVGTYIAKKANPDSAQ